MRDRCQASQRNEMASLILEEETQRSDLNVLDVGRSGTASYSCTKMFQGRQAATISNASVLVDTNGQ
jgi:hypothetical protein